MLNIGLSTMGSIPFYSVNSQSYPLGAGANFTSNAQLQPNALLNTIGCNLASNKSLACSPPSALSNTNFLSAQVFGWIYGGLVAVASMVADPYFVYNLVLGVTDFAATAAL